MTWTYNGTPSLSTRDAVRLLAGQTSSSAQVLVSDEEISYLVAQEGNAYYAAAAVCEAIGGQYTGLATDKQVGNLRLMYGERGKKYLEQAASLRRRGSLRAAVPYAGGISQSDMTTVEQDTDRTTPAFTVGMTDYTAPRSSSST